jgi:hypothetical protein
VAARRRCGLHCVVSDERPVSQVLSCWDVQERRHLAVKVVRAQGVRKFGTHTGAGGDHGIDHSKT